MGRRGPPPQPTALRLLRGNPGHRSINHDEPQPPELPQVDCPGHLKGDARLFWKRHAPVCLGLGTLTVSDVDTFAAGCVAYAELRKLERLSDTLGIEIAIAKGVRKDLHATRADFMRFSQRFGLDPSSRSNVKLPSAQPKSKVDRFKQRKPQIA